MIYHYTTYCSADVCYTYFYFQKSIDFRFVNTIEQVLQEAFDGDDGETLTPLDAKKLAGINKL